MRRLLLLFPLLLLLLPLAGCGSGDTGKRRDAVNVYFDRVARAESKLIAQSPKIDAALQAFRPSSTTPAELRALVSAHATVADALRRVRALEPPADARRVHVDLVHMLALQSALTSELVWAARFIPQYAAAVAPLRRAGATLSRDVAGAKSSSGAPVDVRGSYADAFGRYRSAIRPTLTKLERMTAPPEFAPMLDAGRVALRRSVVLSGRVQRALTRGDVEAANTALRGLLGVAGGVGAARAQKAQQDAVRAYTSRLQEIARLARAVDLERRRLVQQIG